MDQREEGYCLVLGGGGAKGVYHIGVWRALRELGVRVDAFIGASIGAIIAGFLAQGSDESLEEIGRSITVDTILDLPDELTENGEVKLDLDSLSNIRELFHKIMDNKGLDTSPLRTTLIDRLDEAAIRAGGKDLGIVTVNVSDLEPREVFIEDMEGGKLIDYLMASAAFPGFEQTKIAGKKYVDGGIYDNIPYAMARRRGYRRIIVSDISGAGRNRRAQVEGSQTVYIKNSIDMGGVLDFDRGFLDAFNLLGYLDTMRVFGRYAGYSYFLEPNPAAEADFAARGPANLPPFPERMRHERRRLLASLECAASALCVERVRAYSYEDLEKAIAEARRGADERLAGVRAGARGRIRDLGPALREAIRKGLLDECPYYYYRLVSEAFPKTAASLLERTLVGLHPELPAGLAWLDSDRAE
jgi:NTE family protein